MFPVILANTKFSIDMLKHMCKKDESSNIFFSPLSISSALGLVVLGAEGETYNQMMKTLHFDQMKIMYHDLYEAVNKTSDQYELILANRLYGERTCDFKDEYLHKCDDWCFGDFEVVDFQKDPEGAKGKINQWVKDKTTKTENMDNLLGKGDVSVDTLLVLVSATYFSAHWENPFIKNDVPFYTSKGQNTAVKMMQTEGKFHVAIIPEANHLPAFTILEIPYRQGVVSMFIMLPDEKHPSLKKIEHHITYEKLLEWTEEDKFIPTYMEVVLPMMSVKETYDLEEILKSLHMTDAFNDNCNFNGMLKTPSKKMKLSKVVHKSAIDLSESGTTVAGGSGTVVTRTTCKASNDSKGKFIANHPFLFFIRHNPTKSILFWGRFCG